jgi:hypothetical protein
VNGSEKNSFGILMRKAFSSTNVFMTLMVLVCFCILCGSGCWFRSSNVKYVKEGAIELENKDDEVHTRMASFSDDENTIKKKESVPKAN